MSFWTEEDLIRFHSQSYRSKERLEESDKLGCFYCGAIFRYHLLANFIATEKSSLCPVCGIDAVIPLADIPEAEHARLLEQLYMKYFAGQGVKLKDLMKRHLYLYQQPGRLQEEVLEDIEKKLTQSKRKLTKKVYSYYDYTLSYSIPIYDDEITLYPLEQQFVDWLIPERYRKSDFPNATISILKEIVKQESQASSFIIELPGILKEREAEHIIKLLGLTFGGYFTHIDDLPSDGLLTKKEHIYIEPYPNFNCDIINNLEKLLEENN